MQIKHVYLALMLVFSYGYAQAAENSALFDRPLKKQVIPLKRVDPYNKTQPKLSCFYYRQFMVKEVDMAEKGAEKLSITPITAANRGMACKKDNPGEINIKNWPGYFAGVKGKYVFFDGDDGYNGGLSFAVFNSANGMKLFEDSRELKAQKFHSIKLSGDDLVLRYRRSYHGSCSLYENEFPCWKKITMEAGIAPNVKLDCPKLHQTSEGNTTDLSMVGYEIEAIYKQNTFSFISLPGTASCWGED